jgi:hypothetical protein
MGAMSRTGDVMRARVGLLAGLLLLPLGSGVVAQSPSPEPPPWFGGRVEMAEHGFAVTLPDDWLAIDLTTQVEPQAQRVDDVIGDSTGEWLGLAETLSGYRDQHVQLWVMMPLTASGCGVAAYQAPAGQLDGLANDVYLRMSGTDDMAEVERPVSLELTAGPARRLVAQVTSADYPGTYQPIVYYLIEAGDATHLITCTGDMRPADDWLAIAETFELMPADR